MKGERVLLALVILLSAIVRFWGIEHNPPGMSVDEAAAAVDARSIMLTGRDMWGESFPLFFKSLGDYNSGFHRYLMVPFVAVFGFKISSARAVSALLSLLTVAVCYFIGRKLGGARLGLLSAMFFGFSPWSIMYARVAQEQVLLPLFLALIIWAFVVWRDAQPRFYKDLSLGALFALAFYSYQPARVLVPALFVGFILIELGRIGMRRVLAVSLGFALVLIPAVHFLLAQPHEFFARAKILSIFYEPRPIPEYILTFASNYFAHYSPQFLFFTGDANPRHSPAGFGMMYALAIFLIPAGFAYLFKSDRRAFWLFFLLTALYPLPAALTRFGIPHGLRSLGALPALELLSAMGLMYLLVEGKGKLKAAIPAIVAGEIILFLFFAHHLIFKYPAYSKLDWRWDHKELFLRLDPYKATHQVVLFSHERLSWALAAFYWKADPVELQERQRVFNLLVPVSDRFAQIYAVPDGVRRKLTPDRPAIIAYSAQLELESRPRLDPWEITEFPTGEPAFYLYLLEPRDH